MKQTNSVYTGLQTTIFEEMSRLAIASRAVNLGQGFPDVDGPEDIRREAAEALVEGPNQYPPMMGLAPLREAVARNWQRFHGLEVDRRPRCSSPPAPPKLFPTRSTRSSSPATRWC
jgi:aspartate/methionine/tyrosine aminotransferase